jgi:hypothetical protein
MGILQKVFSFIQLQPIYQKEAYPLPGKKFPALDQDQEKPEMAENRIKTRVT